VQESPISSQFPPQNLLHALSVEKITDLILGDNFGKPFDSAQDLFFDLSLSGDNMEVLGDLRGDDFIIKDMILA
jgi:hypothetical protein